jgi:hypothetical protein
MPINLLSRKLNKLRQKHGYISTQMLTKQERRQIMPHEIVGGNHNVLMAKMWIRDQVRKIGLDFNLDTPYENYTDKDGKTLFSHNEADEWNVSLQIAYNILGTSGIDPYEVALNAMEEFKKGE